MFVAFLPRFRASRQTPPFESGFASATHCTNSLAIAAFPASFFATIPSYDFSPSITVGLSIADLSSGLPRCGNDETSLGHVIVFPPNPALLTFEAFGGIGRSLLLQGYPASPANMVYAACSGVCLPILRTLPHGQSTMGQLCASATSRCARDFHPLVRCAAKRTRQGCPNVSSPFVNQKCN